MFIITLMGFLSLIIKEIHLPYFSDHLQLIELCTHFIVILGKACHLLLFDIKDF